MRRTLAWVVMSTWGAMLACSPGSDTIPRDVLEPSPEQPPATTGTPPPAAPPETPTEPPPEPPGSAPEATLSVSNVGAGSGTITSAPPGIDCGETCSATYAVGTPVTLVASAAAGSRFAGWSGGGCGEAATCVVTVGESSAVTARWAIAQASGTWRAVAPMAEPRSYHTATVLPSGKVLVAGGSRDGVATASAELYDPVTERWEATSPMTTPRRYHRATLLASGEVLVTDSDGAAELYDPSTGAWTVTGSMTVARAIGHTATLLPSGKVLVTGGWAPASNVPPNSPAASALAELYDPETGTWSPTGAMLVGREHHSATLLTSGLVLVLGGRTYDMDVSFDAEQAELYDPESGTWMPAGSITSDPPAWHTATLLQTGVVAVVGGVWPTTGGSWIRDAIDLYTPGSGWSTATMLAGRVNHTATLLPSGNLLIVGGRVVGASGFTGAAVDSVEIYGPPASGFAAPMTTARAAHTASVLPSGDVLVVGGFDGGAGSADLASAEVYRE
jgi:hypothetical protein